MFHPEFHKRLRWLRERTGLRQKEAAEACGLTTVRWSHLESGYRNPSPMELRIIGSLVNLGKVSLRPSKVYRELRKNGTDTLPKPKYFLQPRDRASFIRYKAALKSYPILTHELETIIRQRSDFRFVEYFCHNVRLDSGLEALHLMLLLARGAKPVWAAPLRLGHLPHRVVDPRDSSEVGHHKHLALSLSGSFYFPQVVFCCPQTIRVDLLVHHREWRVVELNGRGHDKASDASRGGELKLPVSFFTDDEIQRSVQDFLISKQAAENYNQSKLAATKSHRTHHASPDDSQMLSA